MGLNSALAERYNRGYLAVREGLAMTAQQLADQLEVRDRARRRLSADLHFLFNCPSDHPSWLQRLRRELDGFQETLSEHFALQEENGYLDQVESQAPHYHEQVMRLHQEQQGLMRELQILQDGFAVAGRAIIPCLSRRLADLLTKIEEHESRRNTLVQNAFNEDPGAMD